jgi:3-oxoacyl-[acyl-carrier protein] reductase
LSYVGPKGIEMKIILAGSSTGIGRDITKKLLATGHDVFGLSRSQQSGTGLDLEVSAGKSPGKFRSAICDVNQWEALQVIAQQLEAEWGAADALISCTATHGVVGPAMSVDPKQWCQTVHQNLDGVFYTIRAFFSLLRKSKNRSKVICFSGGGATAPRVNFSAYGAAKTAIVRLTENLAEEWKGLPMDINSIAPGAMKTRLIEEMVNLGPERVGAKEFASAQKIMKEGGGSFDKIFSLIEFLISPESDGLSGKLLAAQWDPWKKIPSLSQENREQFFRSETYTLRRSAPQEWI